MPPTDPFMTGNRQSRDTLRHLTACDAQSTQMGGNIEQARATTSPSPVHTRASHEAQIGQFPIPQIQGVVPGVRRARRRTPSHSLVPRPATHTNPPSNEPASPSAQTPHPPSTISHRSNYPRASPPCFLYPAPIVPHTLAAAAAPNMQPADAPLSAVLPTSLKAIFLLTLAAITLGTVSALLTFCINFPPRTWRALRRTPDRERKDPSNSRVRHTEEMELRDRKRGDDGADAMRHGVDGSVYENPFSPRYQQQRSRHSSSASVSSGENPFLDPPGARARGCGDAVVRSSGEWARARAAFFGDAHVDVARVAGRGLEGREEGEVGAVGSDGEDTIAKKCVRWLDHGLEMLDEALGNVCARMVRWMDDDDEGPGER